MRPSRERMISVSRRGCFSWSNLPGKIIFRISKNLKTRSDIVRFKQVCKKWHKRSLTPPKNLLSLNSPLPTTIKDSFKVLPFHNFEKPLVLRVSNIYLISPRDDDSDQFSKPWMVMAEEVKPGKIKVRHPLTATTVRDFPPSLDLNRFGTLELAQGYKFKSSNCVHKTLACSSSASSVEVMALFYKGVLGKLSLEVLESGAAVDDENDSDNADEGEVSYSWKNFRMRQGGFWFRYWDDVVRFRGMTCGVDRKGKLYVLDTEAMSVANATVLVTEPICRNDRPSNRKKRLVVDSVSEELHLVVRENIQVAKRTRFKVYKLNEQGKKWDLVENIGNDRVLVVGIDHCFFALARHFPGCDGNSIVFASRCFTRYDGLDSPDQSLFIDEEIEVGVYHMGEGDNFHLLSSACPEFAGIIWPPPSWFSTRKCKDEMAEEDNTTQGSDEAGTDSFVSLPNDHVEGLLFVSSSSENKSSSDKDSDDDVVLLSSGNEADEIDEVDDHVEVDGDEDMTNSNASLPNGQAEGLLLVSSSDENKSTSDKDSDADVVMLSSGNEADEIDEVDDHVDKDGEEDMDSECSGTVVSKTSNKSQRTVPSENNINSAANLPDQIEKNHSDAPEQTKEELSDAQEQPVIEHFALPSLGIEEGLHCNEAKLFGTNSTPFTPAFSGAREKSSAVKFQGVEIRSELLPTLETIWSKHGNLIGKTTIRSKKMLAGALEDLAELVITLKNTTGRRLTDSKIDDMRSTLSDIKLAGLKVNWLEPVIEKAMSVQKNKPFIESVAAVDKKKAKIEIQEREFLAETAKKKQQLEKDRAILCSRIPIPVDQIIDLDDCLGDGI